LKNHFFSKNLNVKNEGSKCRIFKLACWKSTSKIYKSLFLGIYEIITIKDQSFFFGSFLTIKFFTPKFMKIICCLGIFTTFGRAFQIKLTMYNTLQEVYKLFLLCPASLVDTLLCWQLISPSFLYKFCSTDEDKMFDSRGESSYCWNAPRQCKGCRNCGSIRSSQKHYEYCF
jgi:hypothetical protein